MIVTIHEQDCEVILESPIKYHPRTWQVVNEKKQEKKTQHTQLLVVVRKQLIVSLYKSRGCPCLGNFIFNSDSPNQLNLQNLQISLCYV